MRVTSRARKERMPEQWAGRAPRLGDTHQCWDDAVEVGAAVRQRLLDVRVLVEGLQDLVECLELQGRLLLRQLHARARAKGEAAAARL